MLIGGKWNYEKIELVRFAIKYNERSSNNIAVKVNPMNGQVCVTLDFLVGPSMLRDPKELQ